MLSDGCLLWTGGEVVQREIKVPTDGSLAFKGAFQRPLRIAIPVLVKRHARETIRLMNH